MPYRYDDMGDDRFQQMCQALLAVSFPDLQCLPVGQADGGRDAVSNPGRQDEDRLVFQVKWTGHPDRISNPVAWLKAALAGEQKKITRLIDEGLKKYILMTNVASTSTLQRGTFDRFEVELDKMSEELGVPISCWWKGDIDRRMDTAPDALKFSYPEVLVGSDAMRALIANNIEGEHSKALADLMRNVAAAQWDYDDVIRFKQVGIETADLTTLFVDVPAQSVESTEQPTSTWPPSHPSGAQIGGAELLLDHATRHLVILGAPGQGKSTLLQYVCQIHRAALLNKSRFLADISANLTRKNGRFAVRADLRDFAVWLDGHDPLTESSDGLLARCPKGSVASLESFLAHLMHVQSGGRVVTVEIVQEIFDRYPVLLALDGLDEVASKPLRKRVVDEVCRSLARLDQGKSHPLAVITSRPSFSSLPEPPRDRFDYFTLTPLTDQLRRQYVVKWSKLQKLTRKDSRDVARIFKTRSADAHIRDLVENPMQLAILLYLIHRRGESVPTHRTQLYQDYMSLFLDREAAKNTEVSTHRDLLEDVTRFLGWTLQAAAEADAANGRLPLHVLKKQLRHYLADHEKPADLVDVLFTAVTERVWAITSRVQNSFEFDVQPVREFFAAEHLSRTAPPSRRHGAADKFDRLEQLALRPYWLNTVRFMAGSFTDGELGTLADTLDSVREADPTRLWPRRVTRLLLSDGTFDARPRSTKAVTRNSHDELGQRLFLHDIDDQQSVPLDKTRGGTELVDMLREQLRSEPKNPLASERARLLALHDEPDVRARWWYESFPRQAEAATARAWLLLGIPLQAAAHLSRAEVEPLSTVHPEAPRLLLAAGACPATGSKLESAMRDAVLAGVCSELGAPRTSHAADLLRALHPSRFLHKARPEPTHDPAQFGLAPPTAPDSALRGAISRLRKHDELRAIVNAGNDSRGQRGTTSVWGNVARAIIQRFGPCWLASEIAIIGASAQHLHIGGDVTPGAPAFGPSADPGIMIADIRSHRRDSTWWAEQTTQTNTEIQIATWLLALAACANESTISDCLDLASAKLESLSNGARDVLLAAAARLGMHGVARTLPISVIERAAQVAALPATLLAPFILPAELPSLQQALNLNVSTQMAGYGPSSWPITWAAWDTLTTAPEQSTLILKTAGPATKIDQVTPDDVTVDVARQILSEPTRYSWRAIVAAEHSLDTTRTMPDLRALAEAQAWFDEET